MDVGLTETTNFSGVAVFGRMSELIKGREEIDSLVSVAANVDPLDEIFKNKESDVGLVIKTIAIEEAIRLDMQNEVPPLQTEAIKEYLTAFSEGAVRSKQNSLLPQPAKPLDNAKYPRETYRASLEQLRLSGYSLGYALGKLSNPNINAHVIGTGMIPNNLDPDRIQNQIRTVLAAADSNKTRVFSDNVYYFINGLKDGK